MTRAEIRAVSEQLERMPDLILRLFADHPNQVSELALNEALVRGIKQRYVTLFGKEVHLGTSSDHVRG